MRLCLHIPHSLEVFYFSVIVLLIFLPTTVKSQSRKRLEEEIQRQSQSAVLPWITRVASGLSDINAKIYEGARSASDVLAELDESEARNPGGLLARTRQVLSHAANSDRYRNQPSSSSTAELEGMQSPETQPEEHVHIDNLLSGLGAIYNAVHGRVDHELVDDEDQQPGELHIRDSTAKGKTPFQERLSRLAATFDNQEGSSQMPAVEPESFTLGPVSSPVTDEENPGTVNDSSSSSRNARAESKTYSPSSDSSGNLKVETSNFARRIQRNDGACWKYDSSLSAKEFHVKGDIPDAASCQQSCQNSLDCKFFSYSSAVQMCSLFNQPTAMRSSRGVTSGPANCSILTNNAFSFWPRKLQGVEDFNKNEDPVDTKTNCISENTEIRGHEFILLEGIVSVAACQKNCQSIRDCRFFSYHDGQQECSLFDRATGVDYSNGIHSGPKSCTPSAKTSDQQPSGVTQNTGPVVAPGETIEEDTKNDPRSDTEQKEALEGLIEGQGRKEETITGQSGSGGGFLGSLLNSGLLGRLGALGGGLGGGERELENLGASAIGGVPGFLKTFHTLVDAGETVLKTFPVADIVKTGYELSNSGMLQRQGRARSKKDAIAPPLGVKAPEVACLSEGMRCCVPRSAAPKYQLDPPKLNDVDNTRCVATYVSQWDSLCTTTKYDDDECDTTIVETADVIVYRNFMSMPGRTMNNAICECTVSKKGGDTQSSGKWEYSLARKEEATASKQRNEEAVKRLANAAKVAMQWGEVLGGRPSPQGGGSRSSEGGSRRSEGAGGYEEGSENGSATSDFIYTLIDLADNIGGQGTKRSEKVRGNMQGMNTREDDRNSVDDISSAAGALLGAFREIKEKSRPRRLQDNPETIPGPNIRLDTNRIPTIPVPYNCSVWREECEHSFERLLFDEKCNAIKIIENGCPREDTEFKLLDLSTAPSYRFTLPSSLSKIPLGIVCEFVFIATPSSLESASVCLSGKPFPVPNLSPFEDDEWPEIRERGPLLEMLLAADSTEGAMLTASLLQPVKENERSNIQQKCSRSDNGDQLCSDHNEIIDQTKQAVNIRGLQQDNSDGQRQQGTHVFLKLDTAIASNEGEIVSVVYSVGKSNETERWGEQARLHSS